MSKRLILCGMLISSGLLLTWSCTDPSGPEPGPGVLPRALTAEEVHLLSSTDRFGLDLFREVVRQEPEKNVFISPLSVSMALGMTANGAADSTLAAMRATLELSDLTEEESNAAYKSLIELLKEADKEVRFDIANSIWYRDIWTFNEDFLERCWKWFDAVVRGMDFSDPATVDIINAWVKENTNGRIEEIVEPPINPLTAMFLINALYFKGTWTYEFEPEDTEDDEFTLLDGSTAPCRMMSQETDLLYMSTDRYQAVDLPYGNELFSMTVLLPGPQIHIDTLAAELSSENWAASIGAMDTHAVQLYLPRFKLSYKLKMNDVLTALGMGIAFDQNQAGFRRMLVEGSTYPGNLFIDKVLHKTFVQVDEEGTEAAAVTMVEMGFTSYPGPSGIIMRVDRPFVFVIRERTSGALLFMGKIVEPVWEN